MEEAIKNAKNQITYWKEFLSESSQAFIKEPNEDTLKMMIFDAKTYEQMVKELARLLEIKEKSNV